MEIVYLILSEHPNAESSRKYNVNYQKRKPENRIGGLNTSPKHLFSFFVNFRVIW